MKARKLFFLAAAFVLSANVVKAQFSDIDCLRELVPAPDLMYIHYTHIQGVDNAVWDDVNGVLSGSFSTVQAEWGGQTRLNLPPVVFSPGAQFVTIRMRVEVGWEGEGSGAAGLGGYLPLRLVELFGATASTGITASRFGSSTVMRSGGPEQGIYYLEFENLLIPAAATGFQQLRIIFGWSHAGTTFRVSDISICEVDFTPPVYVCGVDLFEGVQFTATSQRPHMGQEDWATWDNGVITVVTQGATSSPWGLQLEFGFPNITVNPANVYGLFATVEVSGGTFTGNFRIYSPGNEFNYPGPGATERRAFTVAGSPHTVELVRFTNPPTFLMVNRFSLFGGAPAGTTITISNIRFCRMEEYDDTVGIPPVKTDGMSIHQTGDMIVINSDVEITSAVMFTVSGQQVAAALRGNQIDTSALASGVYLLQVNGTNVFRVIVR